MIGSLLSQFNRGRAVFVVDDLEVGVLQSGAPLLLPRPSGDPQHGLVSGTTGSGKSVFQRALSGALALSLIHI